MGFFVIGSSQRKKVKNIPKLKLIKNKGYLKTFAKKLDIKKSIQ